MSSTSLALFLARRVLGTRTFSTGTTPLLATVKNSLEIKQDDVTGQTTISHVINGVRAKQETFQPTQPRSAPPAFVRVPIPEDVKAVYPHGHYAAAHGVAIDRALSEELETHLVNFNPIKSIEGADGITVFDYTNDIGRPAGISDDAWARQKLDSYYRSKSQAMGLRGRWGDLPGPVVRKFQEYFNNTDRPLWCTVKQQLQVVKRVLKKSAYADHYPPFAK